MNNTLDSPWEDHDDAAVRGEMLLRELIDSITPSSLTGTSEWNVVAAARCTPIMVVA
jgi:hypothetical protein